MTNSGVFRFSWALGGGAAMVVWAIVAEGWSLPNPTSVTVYASGPGMPTAARVALLATGIGAAFGGAAFCAVSRYELSRARRVAIGVTWMATAAAAVLESLYLIYRDGGVDNPLLALSVTLPFAGAAGGGIAALIWKPVSAWRVIKGSAVWAIALGAARVLLAPVMYLMIGALIDLMEAAGVGVIVGWAVGAFATGASIGYLIGAVGAVTLPSGREAAARAQA